MKKLDKVITVELGNIPRGQLSEREEGGIIYLKGKSGRAGFNIRLR